MLDDLGNEIEEREYNQTDMDRILVLNKRTKLVADRVMEFLRATDPMSKTIIFAKTSITLSACARQSSRGW